MRELILLHHKKKSEKNRIESETRKGIDGSRLICLCLHIADEPPVR